MTTELFRAIDFEAVLNAVAKEYGKNIEWAKDGLRGGELHYHFTVRDFPKHGVQPALKVLVEINSTILRDGLAAATGENSIRAWLSTDDGSPLGNKIQRWVTRVPGWQKRLTDMLLTLLEMGDSLQWCEKCNSLEKVFIVKKEGKNKGRLFVKCNCAGSFTWLDLVDQEEEPTPAPAKASPMCPKCGAKMIRRTRKSDNKPFWGCSLFPACNGTRNISAEHLDEKGEKAAKAFAAKAEKVFGTKPSTAVPSGYDPDMQMSVEDFKAMKASQRFSPEEEAETRELQRRDHEDEMKRMEAKFALEHQDAAAVFGVSKEEFEKVSSAYQHEFPVLTKVSSEPDVEKPKGFVPSEYHKPIFDWVRDPRAGKALVIGARAGSGKTSTGLEVCKKLNPSQDILFLAFGVDIVATLKARLPGFVKVRTCHSLGFAACFKAFGNNLQKEDDKEERILKTILDKYQYGYLFPTILKLVSLVKANLAGTTQDELETLAEYYGVELNGDTDTVFAAVGLVVERSMTETQTVSFDDMDWLPVVLNLPLRQYDFIGVDEAQDLNKTQAELIFRSLKKSGRVAFFGDQYQSMYGFRGADAKAIPNIIERFGAKELPLSITYRNPRSVVRYANERFPEIPFFAAEWAEEGEIRHITDERALLEYAAGDMVICRTNAPLVKPVFQLIRKGVKATIRGRDIGKGLLVLIRKINAQTLPQLMIEIEDYRRAEVEKLLNAKKGSQAESINDKCETIIALCDGINTITELEARIDAIFTKDAEGVVFSSIHRAKGLEAGRVYILRPDLLPHPMAAKDWEKEQERNIEYVAVTRALHQLIFVDGK